MSRTRSTCSSLIVVVTCGDEVMNLSDLLVRLLLDKQYYGFFNVFLSEYALYELSYVK